MVIYERCAHCLYIKVINWSFEPDCPLKIAESSDDVGSVDVLAAELGKVGEQHLSEASLGMMNCGEDEDLWRVAWRNFECAY